MEEKWPVLAAAQAAGISQRSASKWLARFHLAQGLQGRLVFGTGTGCKESRRNVRQRLFLKAIPKTNTRLSQLGIDPIGDVRPHGLRRTYASLRAAVGDDVVYTSRQLGHTDVRFTLNTYAMAVKRRERMTPTERAEYDRAVEWASFAESFGTDAETPTSVPTSLRSPGTRIPRNHVGVSGRADARTRTADPIITSDVLYQLSYVGNPAQT